MITIKLNGVSKELRSNTTISDIIKFYNLKPATVIVELNHRVIEIDEFDIQLNNNDIVELINFVGGG